MTGPDAAATPWERHQEHISALRRIENCLEGISAKIHRADPTVDATLERVAGSHWTPAIVAGALIAAFCAGVWIGLKF